MGREMYRRLLNDRQRWSRRTIQTLGDIQMQKITRFGVPLRVEQNIKGVDPGGMRWTGGGALHECY